MKKSLIALAVAGVVSAPAFAATSNVDVYGIMNIAVEDKDIGGVDMHIVDNVSRIGFKGSEDLGGGMKAVWQIEQGISGAASGVGGGTSIANRNTFIGLAGGFGTVLMGRHDTPYKLGTGSLDIFGDTVADYNSGRLNGVDVLMNTHDHRDAQALAYISPTWGGFHFAVAAVMAEETAGGNAGSGLGNDDLFDAVSATGVYVNGPLFASLSYQDVNLVDSTALKLGVGYTMGDTAIGFVYEDVDVGALNRDSWLVNVKHSMGPIVLKAQYGSVDSFGVDQTQWALGADYNLSKRTSVYAVYGNGDSDATRAAIVASGVTAALATTSGDVSGFNIGVKHSF